MYTVNAAYSMEQENKSGFLAKDMDADFIIIDRDIFALERAKDFDGIAKTQVCWECTGTVGIS